MSKLFFVTRTWASKYTSGPDYPCGIFRSETSAVKYITGQGVGSPYTYTDKSGNRSIHWRGPEGAHHYRVDEIETDFFDDE
jgi:hypothetical protein